MRYLPLTDPEREEIKQTLGIREVSELFTCVTEGSCSPRSWPDIPLPAALSELELVAKFDELAARNTFREYLSFLGGGAYWHFIPEVVQSLSTKGEFVTPYTPYQPEVSQGNLQAMFEYQTMITMLTGLDVANASLYDGGTAVAEGALLAMRRSGKKRILLASSLHPEYRGIVRTYLQNLDCTVEEVPFQPENGKIDRSGLEQKLDDACAAFIFQSPNFFGVVEESAAICQAVHARGAFAVQAVGEAMSLPYLKSPGECGVDIVVGEAQSFGLPLSFGGPYLGFMAARTDFLRHMPGRIVGQTRDLDGKRGYVLTLSTREQHIKRERATSNICSNQAWCAVRAGIYLATMGKSGLERVSRQSHLAAAYFVREVSRCLSVRIWNQRDFYNEVVLEVGDAKGFLKGLRRKKILGGIPLDRFYGQLPGKVLVAFTEMHSREMVDRLVNAIGETK